MNLWPRRRKKTTDLEALRKLALDAWQERMQFTTRVIDNRIFLLGLDGLYRDAVKPHERGELLDCARKVANVLGVRPRDGPVEGYYSEHPQLTEYFKLIRALQEVPKDRISVLAGLFKCERLLTVTSAALYGRSRDEDKLLSAAENALTRALSDCQPEWNASLRWHAPKRKRWTISLWSVLRLGFGIPWHLPLSAKAWCSTRLRYWGSKHHPVRLGSR